MSAMSDASSADGGPCYLLPKDDVTGAEGWKSGGSIAGHSVQPHYTASAKIPRTISNDTLTSYYSFGTSSTTTNPLKFVHRNSTTGASSASSGSGGGRGRGGGPDVAVVSLVPREQRHTGWAHDPALYQKIQQHQQRQRALANAAGSIASVLPSACVTSVNLDTVKQPMYVATQGVYDTVDCTSQHSKCTRVTAASSSSGAIPQRRYAVYVQFFRRKRFLWEHNLSYTADAELRNLAALLVQKSWRSYMSVVKVMEEFNAVEC